MNQKMLPDAVLSIVGQRFYLCIYMLIGALIFYSLGQTFGNLARIYFCAMHSHNHYGDYTSRHQAQKYF